MSVQNRFGKNGVQVAALAIASLLAVSRTAVLAQDATPAVKGTAMDERFDELAEQFLDAFPALSPADATTWGDHRFDHQLDDVSEAAREKRRTFCKEWLTRLARFDRNKLSRAHQVDLVLWKERLKKDLWELDRLQEWAWNPIAYTQLTGGAIYGLMARDFAPVNERLVSVAARLEQYPRLFEQIRSTLDPKRVPLVHAETASKQNKGVLSIIENMVKPQMGGLSDTDRRRLEQAIADATEAVQQHQEWLENELVPHAAGDFRLGPELYDEKLAFSLGASLSRQEIRERAEFELKRVRAEMYEIARTVLAAEGKDFPEQPGDDQQQEAIAAALEKASADVPPRDGIVPAAKASLEVTTAFVRSHDLITLPADPLEIILMPEFQRGVSVAYCDSPGPLEVGESTFYAVAPLPKDWTDAQCDSFLREYNLLSINNLTVHEAMPGHFVQLAHANRYPSKLRLLLSSGPFVEGWACYCEQMMSEEGFMRHHPLMRLVTLKWYLRSIANAILDQSIHYGGMRRPEAMKLMTERTFQEEREAAGKWTRAQVTSAQLSTYFVGYQEHRDMREAVEKAWGKDFTLKRYHDAVVSYGSPPVRFVKALILEEPIPE